MQILVLGGTGTMGSYLVKQLTLKKNNHVVVTSRSPRTSTNLKIQYIQGNAHDISFLKTQLQQKYDAIVDFMIYTTQEFEERCELFLSNTSQYVFVSSARVYANSNKPITESAPRLLDVCEDQEYLLSDEYALAKARQENILINNNKKNWTIVRPYITYSPNRLQLGMYEKEHWLYRALHKRPIVFTKDIANTLTTVTFGDDVAQVIGELINNPKALGEIFQTIAPKAITWGEILECYLCVIEKEYGFKPEIQWVQNLQNNSYRFQYDRKYNRVFDNGKLLMHTNNKINFCKTADGLEKCLVEFMRNGCNFNEIEWVLEAEKDKICKTQTPLSEIPTYKDKIKYVLFRYAPKFARLLKKATSHKQ